MKQKTKQTVGANKAAVAARRAVASRNILASAKKTEASILTINDTQKRIHTAFSVKDRKFTAQQVKTVLASLLKLNKQARELQGDTAKNFKAALKAGLSLNRLTAQANSLAMLRSNIAAMARVAEDALGTDEVQFDDTGLISDGADGADEVTAADELLEDPTLPIPDDMVTGAEGEEEPDGDESEVVTGAEGDGEEESDGDELGLDLPDSANFDESVADVLGDETDVDVDEGLGDEVVTAKASLRKRRLASSKKQASSQRAGGDILSQIAAEGILG